MRLSPKAPSPTVILVGVNMANPTSKAKAIANIKKNRLHITIAGTIDVKSLEKLYTEIRFCVADLKKGFDVISDISQCNFIYITGLPVYKKIIDYLIANKVGEIVRIVKNGNISCRQIINFSERIHSYRTIYADDEQQAENKLENLVRRDGIRFRFTNFMVEYNVDNESGQGNIVDISTSGCAVEAVTIPLSVDMDIDMTFKFDHHQIHPSLFQIKARVVRAQDHMFATQFLELDDQRREAFYDRLAYEVSRLPFVL